MIILVEDNADQRLALRLALEQAHYPVREAVNGREALALQRARPSPFVLTDIFMPEADGFELVDTIKKEFPPTKIIVISGAAKTRTVDYLASVRLIGVDATFEKPFKVDSLLKTIERRYGRRPKSTHSRARYVTPVGESPAISQEWNRDKSSYTAVRVKLCKVVGAPSHANGTPT